MSVNSPLTREQSQDCSRLQLLPQDLRQLSTMPLCPHLLPASSVLHCTLSCVNTQGSKRRKTGASRASSQQQPWNANTREEVRGLDVLARCSRSKAGEMGNKKAGGGGGLQNPTGRRPSDALALMKSAEGGVGKKEEAMQARPRRRGEPGGGGGVFLGFHVLLQPPQFGDKGCRCQGDLMEKRKVSGCARSCSARLGSLEAQIR